MKVELRAYAMLHMFYTHTRTHYPDSSVSIVSASSVANLAKKSARFGRFYVSLVDFMDI